MPLNAMALKWLFCVGMLLGTVLGAPSGCDPPEPAQRIIAYGSFNFTHRIRTSSPEAQALFDQGMLLAANFNQGEAVAAFAAALSYDKLCAMCWWGLAHARAPFQNKPAVPPPDDPSAADYPRYRRADMWAAVEAINNAAAITGLVRKADAEAAAAAAAAELRAQINSTTAAAPAGSSGGGAGPVRLMEQLRRCPPSYGKAAVGRRRSRRLAEGGAGPGGSAAGAESESEPESVSLLTRERHYVAAMADRLSVREVWGEEWRAAELRYAQDMADIAGCWRDDADAAALAAEALANTIPWDFWDPATGAPREATPLVLQLLNESLSRDPLQPLALHLRIHVTEALPAGRGHARAGLAESSADSLLGLLPALDHLQHMPSHTYVRVGRWADAVESNLASLRAAVRGSHACLASTYPDHDVAMLVFAASMGADLARAHTYARVMRELPRFVRDAPASLGGQWGAPLPVWVRFAQWKAVLAMPPPPPPPASASSSPAASAGPGPHSGGGEHGAANSTAAPGDSTRQAEGGELGSDLGLGLGGDVAADPGVDPVLQYPPGQGPPRADAGGGGGQGGGGGGAVPGPGPLRGPLEDTEYTRDGAEYARVLWHFSRALAMAAQAAAAQAELQAALNATGAAPAAAPNATAAAVALAAANAGRREVEAEVAALRAAEATVPPDVAAKPGQGLGIDVPGYKLMAVVLRLFAEARLALLDSWPEGAAEKLWRAVEVEGSGGYYEPPRLGPQPARQCLGWVLLRGGRLREALMTYLEDLSEFPDNPWSIRGLHDALPEATARLQLLQDQLGDQQTAEAAGGGGGGGGGDLAALRREVEELRAAVEAGSAAEAAASAATQAAAGGLRSSCLAFSEHHK